MRDKKEDLPERPPIHVTARGELYVEAKDVFFSQRGRNAIEEMAKFSENQIQRQSKDKKDS